MSQSSGLHTSGTQCSSPKEISLKFAKECARFISSNNDFPINQVRMMFRAQTLQKSIEVVPSLVLMCPSLLEEEFLMLQTEAHMHYGGGAERRFSMLRIARLFLVQGL